MKPNQEQLGVIQDILGSVTNYKETYSELYDHILTALDALPDNTPFGSALHHIVEHELGGKKGITRIETNYKKAATKEIFKRYFIYFGNCFFSPFLLVGVASTTFFYWLFGKSFVDQPGLTVICMFINIIPTLIRRLVIAKARRDGTYGKSSVIKSVYGWFGAFPLYLQVGLNAICFLVSLVYTPHFNSYLYVNLSVFFLNTFNIISICKLCRDEFNLPLLI